VVDDEVVVRIVRLTNRLLNSLVIPPVR
jgi:hypothetical protein